jgi:peptidyl-tRNA hydrolase
MSVYKQFFFLNNDLGMSKGRAFAQVSHMTQVIVEEIKDAQYQIHPPPKYCFDYMKWKKEPIVVVLKASGEDLVELLKLDGARKFVDEEELTVVGFLPTDTMQDIAGKYKLF